MATATVAPASAALQPAQPLPTGRRPVLVNLLQILKSSYDAHKDGNPLPKGNMVMAKMQIDPKFRVLGMLKNHTIEETAKRTGLSKADVVKIRDQALSSGIADPGAKMTRAQQAEQRKQIADWIKERKDKPGIRSKAAQHFGVSIGLIGKIIEEFGLGEPKKPGLDARGLFAFVTKILRGESPSAAGEALGISREYSSKLRDYATETGLLDAVIEASGDEVARRKIQKLIDRAKAGGKE